MPGQDDLPGELAKAIGSGVIVVVVFGVGSWLVSLVMLGAMYLFAMLHSAVVSVLMPVLEKLPLGIGGIIACFLPVIIIAGVLGAIGAACSFWQKRVKKRLNP